MLLGEWVDGLCLPFGGEISSICRWYLALELMPRPLSDATDIPILIPGGPDGSEWTLTPPYQGRMAMDIWILWRKGSSISSSGGSSYPKTPGAQSGVLLNSQLLLKEQVATMVRRAFANLWVVYQLHLYWTGRLCSRVTHALVTSRLDYYFNMLYVELPLKSIWKF